MTQVFDSIKRTFIKYFHLFLIKSKNFFQFSNFKKHLVGFIVAIALLVIDIIVAYSLGYSTEHNYIYDATPYVILLVISFILYFLRLYLTNKKSSTDLIIIIYAFFLFWDIAYKVGWVQNDLLIPSPEGLFYVYKTDSKYITEMVLDSLQLLFWGYLLAIILGTILGLIIGWFQRAREVFIPISNAITLIPPVLMTAWLIMWFPFKEAAIGIIFLAVFWPVFQGTIVRVSEIDKKIIDAAKVMGVTNIGMIFKIVLPYSLPGIIHSTSKSLRGAFMCLVAAEMIGINGGIGFYTETYKAYADYRRVLAGIVTIGFITTIIDIIVNRIEKTVVKWKV
ncbi:MAG: ABC transporter permease subunit [Acholeplasmatales bacterium]|nr:ABC transporter permease subunit [Acholeplasmatales bacterium]